MLYLKYFLSSTCNRYTSKEYFQTNKKTKVWPKYKVKIAIFWLKYKVDMSEWISVEKQLPNQEGQYLVFGYNDFKKKFIKVARFNCGPHQKNSHFYSNQTFKVKWITHWMPLTAPPKEMNVSYEFSLTKEEFNFLIYVLIEHRNQLQNFDDIETCGDIIKSLVGYEQKIVRGERE